MSQTRQPMVHDPSEFGPGAAAARAYDMPAGHTVDTHCHDWPQLLFASSGILIAEIASTRYVVPPQRSLWIPPGVPHAVRAPGGARFRSLYVDPQRAHAMPVECRVMEVTPLIRELILEIVQLCEAEATLPDAEQGVLDLLLRRLQSQQAAPLDIPLPRDPRLSRLVKTLQRNPADDRTLEDWSAVLGASARTLSRVFQREVGMGFGEWRKRLRLLHSLSLLDGGQPVTRVALDCGYGSPSSYIAAFRKAFRRTPGDYLKERR